MWKFLKTYGLTVCWLTTGIWWLFKAELLLGFTCIILGIEVLVNNFLQKRFDDFRELVKKVLTPGDLADRITIASVKCGQFDDRLDLIQQWENHYRLLSLLYPRLITEQQAVSLRNELYLINTEQWDFEDRVRTEKSAEACLGARECNNRRVETKNKINELFEAEKEIKSYKGE